MKTLLVIATVGCFFFASCGKNGGGPAIKGRLVYSSCATAVVQVLDPRRLQLGQGRWQRSASEPVYRNVFAVGNLCSFNLNKITTGETFYFRITNEAEPGCVTCELFDNPPSVKYRIEVVSK